MVLYTFVAMAGLAFAVPLNINLGAYSPALVVGDGEISFGGNEDVSNLMNVLEGAAVNTAANVANANNAGKAPTANAVPNQVPAANNVATGDKVASPAADALLQEQAQQIASLQGLGNKGIAPRVQLAAVTSRDGGLHSPGGGGPNGPEKRDLAGFDRALTFAEAALSKSPKVELGTGKEGSGVGILVESNPAAAGTARAKRDVDVSSSSSPKRVRAKVTTMYVRSGIPASLQNKRDDKAVPRSIPSLVIPGTSAAGRRDVIDAVNLNVDGDQGLTMTFVEEVEEGEDE